MEVWWYVLQLHAKLKQLQRIASNVGCLFRLAILKNLATILAVAVNVMWDHCIPGKVELNYKLKQAKRLVFEDTWPEHSVAAAMPHAEQPI